MATLEVLEQRVHRLVSDAKLAAADVVAMRLGQLKIPGVKSFSLGKFARANFEADMSYLAALKRGEHSPPIPDDVIWSMVLDNDNVVLMCSAHMRDFPTSHPGGIFIVLYQKPGKWETTPALSECMKIYKDQFASSIALEIDATTRHKRERVITFYGECPRSTLVAACNAVNDVALRAFDEFNINEDEIFTNFLCRKVKLTPNYQATVEYTQIRTYD